MTTLAGRMMLERSPLFRGLPAASLQRLAELAVQRTLASGEIIFSQGDPGDALYGVITGRIRISAGTADGKEIYLNVMGPGDTFGEIALLDGGPRTASATAVSPSEVVSIRREHFLELLQRETSLALELLRLLGERLRWTSAQVEDATLLDVPARLAKRIAALSRQHAIGGQAEVTVPVSQEELASFLGVSRQIVNQYLQDWRAKGWVRLGRGAVTVCDPAALGKLAH